MLEVLERNIDRNDLRRLAEIHRQEIKEGFLSSLGDQFLEKLYAVIAASQYAQLIVERQDGRIVGFICGTTCLKKVYYALAFRGGLPVFIAIFRKLLNLRTARRILETALYPSQRKTEKSPEAEILNFCVDADQQGKGIGRSLFDCLVDHLREQGIRHLHIVTGESQKSAQDFYDRVGATLVDQTEVHQGETSLVYQFDISPTPTAYAA